MVKKIQNVMTNKKAKLAAVLCAVSAFAAIPAAFAEETTGGMAELAENTNVVVNMLKNIMSLFSVYPLNIFLIISIVVAAIVIIKKLKR